MKNRNLINSALILALTLCFFTVAKAQYGIYHLKNGLTVAIKTETVPSSDSSPFGNGYSAVTDYHGDAVHRVMIDNKSKIYFGYDLVIEKLGETGKLKVSIKPLSKTLDQLLRSATASSGTIPRSGNFTAKFLPKYPEPIIIDDEDTITLDILENSKTNAKISDFIKIISKPHKFFQPYFSERKKARDFTLNDVELLIDAPEIVINGEKNKIGGGASGNVVWINIFRKGRFIFSFEPHPEYNFQKTGMILDNKIIFDYNGESYEIVNKSPVLGSGGKWNLWIKFEPNYQSRSFPLSSDSSYGLGAADDITFLSNER